MKISGEMASVINIVKKDQDGSKKSGAVDAGKKDNALDVVSVENRQAASIQVENLDQAKSLIQDINRDLQNHSGNLYSVNSARLSSLIS